MLYYLLRRLLYSIPILIGVSLLTFVLFYMTSSPEQMARKNLSAKNPSPKQITTWIVKHGYDKPRSEQFKKHMTELFLFRFGKSDVNGEDIRERLIKGAGPSGMLGLAAFALSLVTTVTFALIAAYYRGTYVDGFLTFLSVFLMSVVYMVYIIAGQFILGKILKYAPLAGYTSGTSAWKFLLLPVIVAVISGLGGSMRLYRTFLLEEMGQDYVRTARAKGVGERAVLFSHVLKNAAIPIITSVVLGIPLIFLGSLLLESFFGIPGLGGLTVDAITNQDFAIVRAMVFIGTILYIIGAMLTDICYALVDPRVRFE